MEGRGGSGLGLTPPLGRAPVPGQARGGSLIGTQSSGNRFGGGVGSPQLARVSPSASSQQQSPLSNGIASVSQVASPTPSRPKPPSRSGSQIRTSSQGDIAAQSPSPPQPSQASQSIQSTGGNLDLKDVELILLENNLISVLNFVKSLSAQLEEQRSKVKQLEAFVQSNVINNLESQLNTIKKSFSDVKSASNTPTLSNQTTPSPSAIAEPIESPEDEDQDYVNFRNNRRRELLARASSRDKFRSMEMLPFRTQAVGFHSTAFVTSPVSNFEEETITDDADNEDDEVDSVSTSSDDDIEDEELDTLEQSIPPETSGKSGSRLAPVRPPRPSPSPKPTPNNTIIPGSDASEKMRTNILNEIYMTEKDYCDSVDTIIKVFLTSLRDKKLLSASELQTIFSNIETIYQVNSALFQDLDKRMSIEPSDPQYQIIGDVFLRHAEALMRAYVMYVGDHQTAFNFVHQLTRANTEFANAIRQLECNRLCKGLDFLGFLIKPVQRICKYPLLLKELLKHVPETHPDFTNLSRAYSTLEGITNDVNELKRFSENLQQMMKVQAQIQGLKEFNIVAPQRFYIREGTFIKVSKGRAQTRHFFLFSDVLVYTRLDAKNPEVFYYAGRVFFTSALIRDLPPSESKYKHSLEVVRIDKGRKSYILCFTDHETKISWFNDLINRIASCMQKPQLRSSERLSRRLKTYVDTGKK